MAFLAAQSSEDLWALIGAMVASITGTIWWTRRQGGRAGDVVARCADGSVIGVWHGNVRHRPARVRAPLATMFDPLFVPEGAEDLGPGDLTAVRVVPEAHGWCVQGLDAARRTLAVAWMFESEDEARRVGGLLAERIVGTGASPLDELLFEAAARAHERDID